MTRGRKPRPTHLKVLDGNPGKRPLNRSEPQPAGGFPPCPERLQGKAKDAYDRFAAQLASCRVGTQLDATALELLAESYAAHVEAAAQVAKNGPVWIEKQEPGKLPKFTYSPFWVVMKNEQKKLVALLTEFGMTPSSRSRMQVERRPSALDEFLTA